MSNQKFLQLETVLLSRSCQNTYVVWTLSFLLQYISRIHIVLHHIKAKVKLSHTCYLVFGLDLISVHRQSAHRWLFKLVGFHYFLPGLRSPTQLKNVIVLQPVPCYTAWWQRHIGMNNYPRLLCSFVVVGISPTTYWSQVQRLTAMPLHRLHYMWHVVKFPVLRYLRHFINLNDDDDDNDDDVPHWSTTDSKVPIAL